MHDVFLSHSSQDNDITRFVADELSRAGLSVWVDFDNLQSGDRWLKIIEEGLHGAQVFVLLLSKASRDSEWCERETLLAMDARKPIQVARIGDIPLPLQLANRQYIDLIHDPAPAVKKLASAVRRDLMKLKQAEEANKEIRRPKPLSADPDQDNFFKYLEQLPGGESNALIARDLYRWAKKSADTLEFGGKITPGFHVRVRMGDEEALVLSVWAYPRQPAVQVQFQYFMKYSPYDDNAMRLSTLKSLNRLCSDSPLLDEQADRRPTLPFNPSLNTADKLEVFKQIMDEVMDNLRSG